MPPETQKEEKTVNISTDKVTDRTPSTPTSRAAVLERGGVRSSVSRRRSESQDSRRGSGSSSPPHISRKAAGESITPPVASRSPSQPPEHARKSRDAETFISCLPPPSVQAIRRSEGRIERNSPAYSSMQPVRREGGTALERNSPLRASVQPVRDRGRKEISNVPASLQPLRDAGKVRDTSTVMPPMHASNVAPSVQPIRDAGKVKETSSVAASSVQPVRTERSLLLSSAIPTITSQPARDLRATNTATHTHSTPETPPWSPHNPTPVRQPTDKASPRTGRGKPSQKQANHVKFREPVVSQVSHSDPTAQYSPASPRERVSPHRPQEAPRKASDVTLLSDTLFTRFEVAKLPHRMQGTRQHALRHRHGHGLGDAGEETDTWHVRGAARQLGVLHVLQPRRLHRRCLR
ncbi:hypothetical protein O3P69_019568 [Scylla paramamosain]|uniref:Uncharacterized protein n=1 Tax=Scylla paramamosain TaxID=85552 RepID=A0AAW0SY95_SCYPA